MNWHIEHHMFAAVPCYHLAELHAAIKHDTPAPPDGLAAVWRVIADALVAQAADSSYTQPVQLPAPQALGEVRADSKKSK
jgi:fatty acid desaturase